MKPGSTIKTYLVLFFYIILGYVFMIFPELYLPPPGEGGLDKTGNFIFQFSVLALITITNAVTAYKFNLRNELSAFWSINKIGYFPIGILVGILVMSAPVILGLFSGKGTWSDLKFQYEIPSLEPIAIFFLIIITLWEELWFRGIYLNYAKRHLSILQISLFMGLLFMISYSLYSKGNFLMVSPNFFILGMLFIFLYFNYRTNWLTFGIMLGVNMATADSPFKDHWLIGQFGILSAILWGLLLFWTVNKYKKKLKTSPEY